MINFYTNVNKYKTGIYCMVLDRIVGRDLLSNKPDVALFIGFVFTIVAFVTSYLIFISEMSTAMIGFASLLILPYIIKIMRPDSPKYTSVFAKNNPSIKFFAFLFIGMALAYTILFGVLSPNVRDIAFDNQLNVISSRFFAATGSFMNPTLFYEIVANNIMIVAIAVILSYFYGSGAIFVLNYNASIAGIVYGSSISQLIWGGSTLFSNPILFLPHTIIEILAYLLAAIAGLALSKPLTDRNSGLIKRDVSILVIIAIVLIVVGGFVEVTVPFLGF